MVRREVSEGSDVFQMDCLSVLASIAAAGIGGRIARNPLRREIRPEREGRRLVHVGALRHLELHRVHARLGPAEIPRDVAALEAPVVHAGEARRRGRGRWDELVGEKTYE